MASGTVSVDDFPALAVARLAAKAALSRETDSARFLRADPTPKQQEFLGLTCQEALFGGAAGGGKSIALLLGAIQYVHVPGYAALLLRRTYADLAKPGALIPRSHEMLAGTPATWNEQRKQWTFPSGATLSFGYLESQNDKYQYQGAEYQYIGFDELTQFNQGDYMYLFSRLRRPAEGTALGAVPLRMRSASNPGGVGAAWVFARFIEPAVISRDRAFVPARLSDNPHLDRVAYQASLANLDPVLQRQLLDGDWNTREGVAFQEFKRDLHVIPTDYEMIARWRRVAGHDWGYSSPAATLWFAIDPAGGAVAYREWSVRHLQPDEVAQGILYRQGDENPIIYGDPAMWREGGRAYLTTEMIATLAEHGKLELTTATQYQQAGVSMQPANNARIPGKLRLHTLLGKRPADGVPYLRFMDCCPDAIATFQNIQLDPDRSGEDVMTDFPSGDPVWRRDEYYDVTRYALMGVPTKVTQEPGLVRERPRWRM